MAQDGTMHRREHKGKKYFILEDLGGKASSFSCLLYALERPCPLRGMWPGEPNDVLASVTPEM